MFSDEISEDWDSTKTQDVFIEKYFSKRNKTKVNATKASNTLKSADTSKEDIYGMTNSMNQSKCNKKKKKEKQSFFDSSTENNFQNIQMPEKSNSVSDCLKSKKVMITDYSNAKAKVTNVSTDSINSINFQNTESSSGFLKTKKKKKRKRVKSVSEEKYLVSNNLDDEINTSNNAVFTDSSKNFDNLSEKGADSYKTKKRRKKLNDKLKNKVKIFKSENFSDTGEISSFETCDLLKESNLSKSIDDSDCLKRKRKNKLSPTEKSLELGNFFKDTENTDFEKPNFPFNKSNPLKNKAYQKLQAAKFRYLNEMLYTNSGEEALSYFQLNTEEFVDYHVGYQSQVSKWPINPVNEIIQEINQLNKQDVIADLGCGEAKIAEVFPKRKVHSFDLIALKDCITACDIANVPLPSSSVDVVVFCLSLMGTNWKDYLKEGHRILKLKGILKIAEIESRIENLEHFIKEIKNFGFLLINQNLAHKMFVFLDFKKVNRSKKSFKVPDVTLKPCLYKRR